MNIIFNKDWAHTIDSKVAIALGSFDGIHRGHKELIQSLNNIKKERKCLTMVYTFREHPMTIISPAEAPKLITDNEQKADILEDLGVDFLVLNEFTTEFSNVSPHKFIKKYLIENYNVDTIVVGYNFRFGARGQGDTETLKQLGNDIGFDVEIVSPVSIADEIISSSKIRKLIMNGDIERANIYLGYPYSLKGEVITGEGRGRHLGFPTANLEYDMRKVVPSNGVYLTLCSVKDLLVWGLTNVGNKPTFGENKLCIETHLLGYSGSLYGQKMEIYFTDRIRDEVRFSDHKSLIAQMNRDVIVAKKLIYKRIQMCYNT